MSSAAFSGRTNPTATLAVGAQGSDSCPPAGPDFGAGGRLVNQPLDEKLVSDRV